MLVLQVVAHLPNLHSKEVFFEANIRMQLSREKCDSLRVEVMLMEGLKAFSFRAYFVANYGVVDSSKKMKNHTQGSILSVFRLFFGRIRYFIICFQDLLTFGQGYFLSLW